MLEGACVRACKMLSIEENPTQTPTDNSHYVTVESILNATQRTSFALCLKLASCGVGSLGEHPKRETSVIVIARESARERDRHRHRHRRGHRAWGCSERGWKCKQPSIEWTFTAWGIITHVYGGEEIQFVEMHYLCRINKLGVCCIAYGPWDYHVQMRACMFNHRPNRLLLNTRINNILNADGRNEFASLV